MSKLEKLRDYEFYSRKFLRIKTKGNGMKPLILRKYQKKFVRFAEEIKGPKRIISVKPRQAGFSTLVSSYFFHKMVTRKDYAGLAMADKSDRSLAIQKLYATFLQEIPAELRPMIETNNTEKIWFDNPVFQARSKNPGLRSGVKIETALDPNAGRSETRKFAHMSENAFYRYYNEIDEGVQNSIPLLNDTCIIKESTANGRAGIGRPFFLLYQAAKRGESIYQPFFVAWYEVDDYAIEPESDFILSPYEKEVMKQYPGITEANLNWRRFKLQEYLADDDEAFLTPEERFKQDFPLNDDEAFLHSGQPVFPNEIINPIINKLEAHKPNDLKERLGIEDYLIKANWKELRIFTPPRQGKKYIIGIDISEGLANGDSTSMCIIDESMNQVARWHGKIDPDLAGHLAISLGNLYNTALLVPEANNMGHTTVTTIRNEGYINLYKEMIEDQVTKQRLTRYGWKTTKKSKNLMISEAIRSIRDKEATIMDLGLLYEMSTVTRKDDGIPEVNGKDRVVAFCLACMGLRHYRSSLKITIHNSYENKIIKSNKDPMRNESLVVKHDNIDEWG